MAKIDVSDVKKRILVFLEQNGPSLPIPIAKHLTMQPMFASAILSELLNEKRIKTSSLRIGSSPLYLIPGQEDKLEKFTENLTGAEKEAFLKLRDNKFLEDERQEPRMRVALRGIKDFAIPIQLNNKLYWKYFSISSDKLKQSLMDEGDFAAGERVVGQQIWEDIKKEKKIEENKESQPNNKIVSILTREAERTVSTKHEEEQEKIVEKLEPKKEIPIEPIKPLKMKKLTEKDLFLEQTKRVLASRNIEVLEVLSCDKKQMIAKARVHVDKNCILLFMDKKRPDEKDLIKAFKKSQEYGLPYYIVTKSEPQKKLKETAQIYKALLGFGSLE